MTNGLDLRRIFSYLFILAIAVVFVLQFGPGSRGCNAPLTKSVKDSAAVVNGKEISLPDFRRAYGQRLQAFRASGSDIPESLARQIGLPGRVLDELVTAELLAQAADAHGIAASDGELLDLLHKSPDFQKDGQFNFARYTEVLRDYYRKTAPDFEGDLRRRLAAGKMLVVVDTSAAVSEEEVHARFLKEGDTVSLSAVRFLPTLYADQVKAPSAAELSAWRKTHGGEIASYFRANAGQFKKGEQARARHILVQVPAGASEADRAAARTKAEALRKEITSGKDFGAVARESSDDKGSKEQGGELGWNERGAWVPAFSQAAFNLKLGEISDPVETPFGWHLIQTEEKKPAEERALEQVAPEIASQLFKKERARALAEAEAKRALAGLTAGKSLVDLYPPRKDATEFDVATKPEAVQTGPFGPAAGSIPQVGPAPELAGDAFGAPGPGPLRRVYPGGEGFVVAAVTDRQRANEETYARKKAELRAAALRTKQGEVRESYLKALRKEGRVLLNQELIAQGAPEAS